MARYTIRKNRINSGRIIGFEWDDKAKLTLNEKELFHSIFLRGIDGAEEGAEWGRLCFDTACSENIVYSVYVLAIDHRTLAGAGLMLDLDAFLSDEEVETDEKLDLMKSLGAKRYVKQSDILLYDLSGQYLYIAIEAMGEGSFEISGMFVDSRGDNFMNTYPEVYRERNGFFHRYISIFSSIYNDFGRDIDALPKLLDLDSCPEELLITYGSWMGIDLKGGFLDTKVLRDLVKEAYSLGRMKGTRQAIERIIKIVLGEDAVIIEHNSVRSWMKNDDIEIPPGFKAQGIYDVTILVKSRLTEELTHQLTFILNQFKPVRTRINISRIDENPLMDSRTYLDINTRIPEESGAILDDDVTLDGPVVLI